MKKLFAWRSEIYQMTGGIGMVHVWRRRDNLAPGGVRLNYMPGGVQNFSAWKMHLEAQEIIDMQQRRCEKYFLCNKGGVMNHCGEARDI